MSNMAEQRGGTLVPNATEMRRYLERGLTQKQIAETWEEDSGAKVSRSAIAMAIARYGLASSHPRERYEDLIPWTVRPEHRMKNDARMLRYEGRRRRGLSLNKKEKRLLTAWRQELEEAAAVVIYDGATEEGFHWVHRRPEDDDIIRRQ